MKKIFPSLALTLAISISLPLSAHQKLDLGSQTSLRAISSEINQNHPSKAKQKNASATPQLLHGFVTLAEGCDATEVESAEGVTIVRQRGNMLIVELTSDALDQLNTLESVKQISLEKALSTKLDLARQVSGIDKIHSGVELPQAYTGKGVVAGIVDGGFDPNHINFKNADGSSRITHFTYYRPTQSGGFVEEKYGADYIPEIDTEDETTFHGTHTTGILAGSYRGKVQAAKPKNAFQGTVEEIDNPYYGVAYDAEIAASAGALSDYYIALGCESILDYAYEQGKPAVINLSLGSNIGPHDGSSTICQFIDLASELDNVIFCVSAGNEGDLPIAISKTLTESDKQVASFLYAPYSTTKYPHLRYGQTYCYSDSKQQFEIQALILNTKRNAVAFRMPLSATDGSMKYWISSNEYKGSDTDVLSLQFAKYFTGYVGLGAEFDETTGRYYAVLDVQCWDNTGTGGSNANGDYILGFQITGSAGQRIDVYSDGEFNNFSNFSVPGYDNGSSNGSISDVATGKNTIVVGSYNTRDDWASLDNGIYGYQNAFTQGKISPFTSWGTLIDGRHLPTVCAPGATIISSANEYYIDAEKLTDASIQARTEDADRKYSWFQCVGTSMATPLVAGSIALWLEADPSLDYKTALDIIKRTAVVDEDVLETGPSVQWGAGKFDAYAGLKEVLKQASVTDVAADTQKPLIRQLSGKQFEIFAPAQSLDIVVSDISGRTAAHIQSDKSETIADLSVLAPGIYIINVNKTYSTRIIL